MSYGMIPDSTNVKQPTATRQNTMPSTTLVDPCPCQPLFGPQPTGGTPVQPGGPTFGTPCGYRKTPAMSYPMPLPLVSPIPTSVTKTYYNGKSTPDSIIQINYRY